MTQTLIDEFKKDLVSRSIEWIAKFYLFEGTPYVFRNKPELTKELAAHLSSELNISFQNIRLIGSAKVGFSLSLDNFPREFSDRSDIDVLIVDEALFDEIWMYLLKWHYPRRLSSLGQVDGRWMRKRRKDIYWGWFHPDKIRYQGLSLPNDLRPLRDISTSWFNAFRGLSNYPDFAERNVSGRLYRSWEHARLYHVDGLRQIKKTVMNRHSPDSLLVRGNHTTVPPSGERNHFRRHPMT